MDTSDITLEYRCKKITYKISINHTHLKEPELLEEMADSISDKGKKKKRKKSLAWNILLFQKAKRLLNMNEIMSKENRIN